MELYCRPYVIIETFHPDKVKQSYKRFEEKGRQWPIGAHCINNWIDEQAKTCYQLMESGTEEKIHDWVQHRIGLADFQIIAVLTSEQAKEKANAG